MRKRVTLQQVNINYNKYRGEKGSAVLCTDMLADILAQMMRPDWRYEPQAGEWYYCQDDGTWEANRTVLSRIIDLVHEVRVQLTLGLLQPDRVFDKGFSAEVRRKLEASPLLQITVDDFDKHYHLLNTPEGPIDLRNGDRIGRSPDLLLRQKTAVAPLDDEDGAKCPNYMKHLEVVSNGHKELSDYLEALSGYALTGYINQQEFYTFYGHGQNGKSALVDTWVKVMGSYATAANPGQFSKSSRMSHPEQDMRLIGKRLVQAEEISSWDLDKLKQFTDGSLIVAREMRGKSTPFTPQAKLIFIGNVKPSLSSNDYGIERRLRLIPFEHRIPEGQRDKFFRQKLEGEAPYILNRMIKAAIAFCDKQEIVTPQYVADASKEYFNEENIIGSFIENCCSNGPYLNIAFGEFHEAFNLWCIKAGFDCPGKKKTQQLLVNMGYKRGKGADLRLIRGIELKKELIETPTPSEYNQMFPQDSLE